MTVSRRRKIIIITACLLLVLAAAAPFVVKYIATETRKNRCMSCLDQGDYRGALNELFQIFNGNIYLSPDDEVFALSNYASGLSYGKQKNYEEASLKLDLVRSHYLYALPEKYHAYLEEKYAEYNAIYRKEREKEERKRAEAEAKKVYDEPYVGMHCKKIDSTKLGKHFDTGTGYIVWINGKKYYGTAYFFDLGNGEVFAARVVNDYVDHTWTFSRNKTYYKPDNDDPYNAKDYRNAEDFYDDNWDNFFGYDDAETYYRKHKDD